MSTAGAEIRIPDPRSQRDPRSQLCPSRRVGIWDLAGIWDLGSGSGASALLLLLLASCSSGPPNVEWLDPPEARPPVLERTAYEFDDSGTQDGAPAWRNIAWEARGEGAQLLVLASRATCDRPRIDDVRTAVFSVDVRSDAPEESGLVLREMDSGRPIAVRRTLRAMLAEEIADYPEDAVVEPWEERPAGFDAWGLSLTIERREGTRLAWRLRNGRDVPVDLAVDPDPVAAIDRGCLSLHVVGPDGRLLPPRPREGRLAAPVAETLPPGGEKTGEIDLFEARDLPEDGVVRVVLVYASYPSVERITSYVEGVAWPRSWPGALSSNELAFRVVQ